MTLEQPIHDHPAETSRVLLDLLRQKSTAERIELAADTSECLSQLVEDAIRQRYPEADDEEVLCRFAVRWLGPEWAVRVYGWDPEREGW